MLQVELHSSGKEKNQKRVAKPETDSEPVRQKDGRRFYVRPGWDSNPRLPQEFARGWLLTEDDLALILEGLMSFASKLLCIACTLGT